MKGKRTRISTIQKMSVAFAEMPTLNEDRRAIKGDFLLEKIKTSIQKINIMDAMSEKIERYSTNIITLASGEKVCRILR